MNKIVELLIDWDNLEFDDLGVEVMSIVDKPAIGVDFLAFSEEKFVDPQPGESEEEYVSRCIPVLKGEGYDDAQAAAICYDSFDLDDACWPDHEAIGMKPKGGRMVPNCVPIENAHQFETYNDYPESAKNAAQRALDWADKNGWGDCGTPVGKRRANQLAKGENISEDTIARMAAFARHLQYKDVAYSEGCGGLMVDAWGGQAGIEWASNKLKKIRDEQRQELIIQLCEMNGEVLSFDDTVYIDGTKSNFENIGDYVKGIVGLDILGKQDADQEPEIKYRYTGPISSNSRNFCKAMIRMGKLYTREELSSMSRSINTGFRHRGRPYSIFDFKGGVNCNHYWEEVEVYREGSRTVVMSKGRADGRAGQVASSSNDYWRYPGTFAFSEDDQMIVTGPAMIPDQLILRKDEYGNPFHVFFSKETVAKIAQKFFEYNKQNNTDINHDDDITTNNTLLESWIVTDPEMDKSKAMGFNVPAGSWMASYKINDEETWQKIKEGELQGFSVAGQFIEKATKA
jgi:hypothetical protein